MSLLMSILNGSKAFLRAYRFVGLLSLLVAVAIGMQCEDHTGTTKETELQQASSKDLANGDSDSASFSLESILGVWTTDTNGPHADFAIDSTHFMIVDQEQPAEYRYEISHDSIFVHFDGFVSKGKILTASANTLQVNWKDQGTIEYFRWED
jgi:hypothetical protein